MQELVQAFFADDRVEVLLLLVVLRFVLGVIAAVVASDQSFRLSFVADILRGDILGKVVPFAVLYAGYLYAANFDVIIPGFDLELVMNGAWAIVLAALGGAIFNSLRDLGLFKSAPDEIAGPDPTTPEVPAPPPGS